MSDYAFAGQQPDEKVLLVLHRHWAPFMKDVARLAVMAASPVVILWGWLAMTDAALPSDSVAFGAVAIFFGLFYLFLLTLLYGFWLDYYLDVFVVTNKRVVDIEQNGLLSRTIAEQPLYRIQDVTSEVNGVFAHLFRYGNVYIQTAGEKERFFFEQVPNPELVVRTILSLTDSVMRDHNNPLMHEERNGQPRATGAGRSDQRA